MEGDEWKRRLVQKQCDKPINCCYRDVSRECQTISAILFLLYLPLTNWYLHHSLKQWTSERGLRPQALYVPPPPLHRYCLLLPVLRGAQPG